MGRIVAIDYGGKRCGIAVTDPMQIIATGLTTVGNRELIAYLKDYATTETIETFVVGDPKNLDGSDTNSTEMVRNFVKHLGRQFPDIPIVLVDEAFTSKMAVQSMVQSGMRKKERRKKENVDLISATIILQNYMEQKNRE